MIAAQIVGMQNIVGALPAEGRFGYGANAKDAPQPGWCGVLYESLARSRSRILRVGLMDVDAVDRVEHEVRRAEGVLNEQIAVPFLHDVTTKNVIVDEGRLSGIVDVDDLCFGDPRFVAALTLMSLLNSGSPVDYVASWLELAKYQPDWKIALYTAVCCVDFMSEYGQEFNGNIYAFHPDHRERLEHILDLLLAAARSRDDAALLPILNRTIVNSPT